MSWVASVMALRRSIIVEYSAIAPKAPASRSSPRWQLRDRIGEIPWRNAEVSDLRKMLRGDIVILEKIDLGNRERCLRKELTESCQRMRQREWDRNEQAALTRGEKDSFDDLTQGKTLRAAEFVDPAACRRIGQG